MVIDWELIDFLTNVDFHEIVKIGVKKIETQ